MHATRDVKRVNRGVELYHSNSVDVRRLSEVAATRVDRELRLYPREHGRDTVFKARSEQSAQYHGLSASELLFHQ